MSADHPLPWCHLALPFTPLITRPESTYAPQKEGELKPGSKGLALSQEQWQKLAAALPDIAKAVEAEEIGHSVDLGNKRLASVTSFKGSLNVDLREHYEKNGDLAPGSYL